MDRNEYLAHIRYKVKTHFNLVVAMARTCRASAIILCIEILAAKVGVPT